MIKAIMRKHIEFRTINEETSTTLFGNNGTAQEKIKNLVLDILNGKNKTPA